MCKLQVITLCNVSDLPDKEAGDHSSMLLEQLEEDAGAGEITKKSGRGRGREDKGGCEKDIGRGNG